MTAYAGSMFSYIFPEFLIKQKFDNVSIAIFDLKQFYHTSRVSNIESDNSQNVGLKITTIFLLESFHILLPPL